MAWVFRAQGELVSEDILSLSEIGAQMGWLVEHVEDSNSDLPLGDVFETFWKKIILM